MTYRYKTHGTCSSEIILELEDGIIKDAVFKGGCNGNTGGIRALIKDMPAEKAIEKLEGIRCGAKPTSCPDQLARALKECLRK